MTNTKMTKTQKYDMIETILSQLPESTDNTMLIEFVQTEKAALARKAAKAKETAAAKKIELDELCEVVLQVLTNEPQTRDQITNQIDGEDVSVAKVGARLTKLVEMGRVIKVETPAVSAAGKKTTRMAYSLAPVEVNE